MKYLKLFEDFNLIEDELNLLPKRIQSTFDGKVQIFALKVEIDEKNREWKLSYRNKKGDFCLMLAHWDIELVVANMLDAIINSERIKIIE